MYLEKQQQSSKKNRRQHARSKCRLTIEMIPDLGEGPIFGHVTDVSMGGCFVETSAILNPGSKVRLVFSIDDGTLDAEGNVGRIDPGVGLSILFREPGREGKDKMNRILDFVQKKSDLYDSHYLEKLIKR